MGAPPGKPRVLAVASHPIQYHAPWFRALATRPEFEFRTLFVERPDAVQQGRGFGVAFEWDIPLLDGYASSFATDSLRPLHGDGFLHWRLKQPRKLLADLVPDVVVMTGWHMAPMVQLLNAAAGMGLPVIMRAEANALRPRPAPARAFHRWLLSQCQAFMPIGRANREFYLGYGLDPGRMFDAPYFVDNERFASAARDLVPRRTELRARWGIPPDATCFCFAGKLEPKKRILDLLAATGIAVRAGSKGVHLLVVGDGEQMGAARAMGAEQGLPVSFAGFLNQTEIAAAYVASDALVLPSDYGETWGLVVNEAMACSRPAVVSDRVGCAADLVQDGRTGYRFPFGDTQALASRLAMLAAAPAEVREMGERSCELVTHAYGVQACAEGTVRAVHAVLERP